MLFKRFICQTLIMNIVCRSFQKIRFIPTTVRSSNRFHESKKVSMKSSNFIELDKDYAIDGLLTNENIVFLKDNYKSFLYLCPDQNNDSGAVDGYNSIRSAFPINSYHIPVVVSDIQFQPNQTNSEAEYQIIRSYKRFDTLPRPIVITCKSNRRAATVITAYKAIKENMNIEETLAYAKSKNLSFLSSEGLVSWISSVLRLVPPQTSRKLVFKQLFEKTSSTYTYLLADSHSKEAILIDPVVETVERDNQLLKDLGLTLKYVINTHVHADHTSGSGLLKQLHPSCQSAISAISNAKSDVKLKEFDSLCFGSFKIFCLSTPGHTKGCLSFVLDDMTKVFTGDALLIRGCGRTDFQGGSAVELYNSVHSRLLQSLPDDCEVLPAHDYKGFTASTIAEEKTFNPRLTKPLEEFINIMDNLNLPPPEKIDDAVPLNMNCGL